MRSRRFVGQSLLTALVLVTAILTVGLTASGDSAFSITLRPVFLRLGLDIDVKLGTMHLHTRWTFIPVPETRSESSAPTQSTKPQVPSF